MQIEMGIVQIVPFPGPYGIVLKAFCTLSVQFIVNSIFSAPKKDNQIKVGLRKRTLYHVRTPGIFVLKDITTDEIEVEMI